jgi:hypothetical protein
MFYEEARGSVNGISKVYRKAREFRGESGRKRRWQLDKMMHSVLIECGEEEENYPGNY